MKVPKTNVGRFVWVYLNPIILIAFIFNPLLIIFNLYLDSELMLYVVLFISLLNILQIFLGIKMIHHRKKIIYYADQIEESAQQLREHRRRFAQRNGNIKLFKE